MAEVAKPRPVVKSIISNNQDVPVGAPGLWAQANGKVPVIEDTTDKAPTHHGMSE
jgi:hypothetical protein